MARRRTDLKQGGKYVLGSLLVEALLLAPKTNVKLGEKEYAVGGVFPMLQREIAEGVRTAFNTVVPKAAVNVEAFLRRLDLKEKIIEKSIWFVYDYMEQFSLNTIVTGALERSNLVDVSKINGLLTDYINGILANKYDRDRLIASITDMLVSAVSVIVEGTPLSVLFSDYLADSLKATASEYLEKFLHTENGEILVERVLSAAEQFENLTLASFLERNMNLGRREAEQFLSNLYEQLVGSDMVATYSNLALGDALYARIAGMDYEAVFKDLTENRWRELLQVTLTAAGAGLSIMNVSKNMDRRAEKRANKKSAKLEKKAAKLQKKAAKKRSRK